MTVAHKDNVSPDLAFNDVSVRMTIDDDKAVFRRTQKIDDGLLDSLAQSRVDSANERITQDFYHVASIPVVVVEKWMREGFNIYDPNNKIEDIMKRIRAEDMERLLATTRQVF